MVKTGLYCVILILCSGMVSGQDTISTSYLKEVEITSQKLNSFSVGVQLKKLDSAILTGLKSLTVSDILSFENTLNVKSFGPGSLSTAIVRGSGGSHTPIFWNGFNLQNPMNGNIDLSLIPGFFVDQALIQKGGNSSLFGTGSVGGNIYLENPLSFSKSQRMDIVAKNASFGSWLWAMGIQLGTKNFQNQTRLFNETSKNDFSYINTAVASHPLERLKNARLAKTGLFQQNAIRIDSNQRIETLVWYQKSDRQIPPSMTMAISTANQKDEFLRSIVHWERTFSTGVFHVRSAFFSEWLLYSDSVSGIASDYRSNCLITEASLFKQLKNRIVAETGFRYSWSNAVSAGYSTIINQQNFTLFEAVRKAILKQRLITSFSARQELQDKLWAPFSPAIDFDFKICNQSHLKSDISINYRLPTMNDRYWNPGGNPLLKPEKGYSQSLSYIFGLSKKNYKLNFSSSVFSNLVNDWILWLPLTSTLWTPENVQKVWAKGIESGFSIEKKLNEFKIKYTINADYVHPEVISSIGSGYSKGDRLIYVPMLNGSTGIAVSRKKSTLIFYQNYTGKRFISTDNSASIKAYSIGNLLFMSELERKKIGISFSFAIRNIWNSAYQVIEWRPMPGINYDFNLNFQIKN